MISSYISLAPEDIRNSLIMISLIGGGIWALFLYTWQRRLEQAKWQRELFKDVYQNERSYDARYKLEYYYEDELAPIIQKRLTNKDIALEKGETDLLIQLDNFLNIFESTIHYKSSRVITESDLNSLFYYWFDVMKSPERGLLRRYLIDFGFKRITEYLDLHKQAPQFVFFYGTLREPEAWRRLGTAEGKDLADKYIDRTNWRYARIHGELRTGRTADLEYAMLNTTPGTANGSPCVYGKVYRLLDPSGAFQLIDGFERFNPENDLKNNLFVRNCKQVECWRGSRTPPAETEKLDAWLYTFNTRHKGPDYTKGEHVPSGWWEGGTPHV